MSITTDFLSPTAVNSGAVNRREFTREDTKALAEQIKERITIMQLGEKLYPGWTGNRSCKSPFRDERNASFSIYANGKRWKDFGTGDGGDLFDFYEKATGCDSKTAFKDLKAMAGLSDDAIEHITAKSAPIKDTFLEVGKVRFHPDLQKPTDADLDAISALRSIELDPLQLAVKRRLLWTATLGGHDAWVLTDITRKAYLARRIDGQAWDHLPSKPKGWLLRGSCGSWPIGCREAADYPAIALTEGGPDFLAAFGHAFASGVDHLVAPICMSGASVDIPEDALRYFAGKRVRIFVHDDDAGYSAGQDWASQLKSVAKVDGFEFTKLIKTNGQPIGDLNDLLLIDYDCWEANRATVESVMSFALEGRN
jgi:hypothetical protein